MECPPSGYDFVTKIILLGDQGVGKSSFLRALRVHPDISKVNQSKAADHVEFVLTTNQGKLALVRLCDTGGKGE